jgi:NTP pyrophosphatase (non-canonical NTP hydrolase)
MADVLFVLLALANEQKIDLGSALEQVLEKYRVRDSDRWKRNPG